VATPNQERLPAEMSQGFVDVEKVKALLPPAGDDTVVLLCGPPMMVNGLKKTLGSLGYTFYAF